MSNIQNIKKLHISRDDKKLAGICGGIGNTFAIDSTIVRLVFIFIALVTGLIPSIVLYVLGWLVIPDKVEAEIIEAKTSTE